MNTAIITQAGYRYPGSRPFYDNEIDRRLFFGRDAEKEILFHKILADNLVVLYARSGLGKTSLLNAGISEALREKGLIPFMVRLNAPGIDPVKRIYDSIEEIMKQNNLAIEPGEKTTMWQYFKTTYFWSAANKMLKPVLILDQFEEFFSLYPPDVRSEFTRQLSEVLNNRIPNALLEGLKPGESLPYDDNPPNVKIVISLREDFLGQLDEMSREIPGILHQRFRLLPLSREQARQAIVEPSKVQDEAIDADSFTFTPDAVNVMLDFLCKRKERGGDKMTDEVESFQLQLLCRHIEDKVRESVKEEEGAFTVKEEDLGGEKGMQQVLQQFYDNQVDQLDSETEKEEVRRLCEEGLISITDRRLSLEEEEIIRKFTVSKKLLTKLVDIRLLRAEPRVGSIYYELSHDTLIAPIRESQKNRIPQPEAINKLYEEAGDLKTKRNYDGAAEKYKEILKINRIYLKAYLELGKIYFEKYKYDKAVEIYKHAINNGIKDALIYYHLGNTLFTDGKIDEAIQNFEEAIKIDPHLFMIYEGLGDVYSRKKDFKTAIKHYRNALNIDKRKPDIYRKLAVSYIKANEPDKAVEVFQKAIKVKPIYARNYEGIVDALGKGDVEYIKKIYDIAFQVPIKKASHYFNLGYDYGELEEYDQAIAAFRKAIEIDPKYVDAYNNLGNTLNEQEKYDEAIEVLNKAIEIDPNYVIAYINIGNAYGYLNKYDQAIEAFKKAIKIDPKYADAYFNMGIAFGGQTKYDDAIAAYRKAIEIDKKYFDAYINMGSVFHELKNYNEAIAVYQKAIEIDPINTDAYIKMGLAFVGLNKYDDAIAAYQKVIEIDPGDTFTKTNLAEAYLNSDHFNEALVLANEILKEKEIPTPYILAMRFVIICSMLFQEQQIEAANQLKDFIAYYSSIPEEYERDWESTTFKNFITQDKKLPPQQRELLLQMIDLLESPKADADKKLKELETSMGEIFK